MAQGLEILGPKAPSKTYGRPQGRPRKSLGTLEEFFNRPLSEFEERLTSFYRECRAYGIGHRNRLESELEWRSCWNGLSGHPFFDGQELTTDNAEAVNHESRLVMTAVAYHTAGDPVAYYRGQEPEDQPFADKLQPWGKWWQKRASLQRNLQLCYIHRKALGGGFIKVAWDPYFYHDNDRGEVGLDAVDPRSLWYNADIPSSDIQDARFIGQDCIRDAYHLARCYGFDLGEFDEKVKPQTLTTFWGGSGTVAGGAYVVSEFFWRDSDHPFGRVATFINDRLIPGSVRDNPTPRGLVPYVSFPDNPIENHPIGRSGLYLVKPLIESYNHCLSIMSDWRDGMVMPPFVCSKDTGLSDDQLHPFSNQAIRPNTADQAYRGIKFLELPSMSGVPMQQMDLYQTMMDVVFGINSMGLQTRPDSGVSGQALRVLTEQNDQRMAIDKSIIHDGLRAIHRLGTSLMLKHYEGDRAFRLSDSQDKNEWYKIVSNVEKDWEGNPIKDGRKWFSFHQWNPEMGWDAEAEVSFADPELDVDIEVGSIMAPTPAVMAQETADLITRYPEYKEVLMEYDLNQHPYLPTREIMKKIADEKQKREQAASQQPTAMEKVASNTNSDTARLVQLLGDPVMAAQYAQKFLDLELAKAQSQQPPPPQGEQGAPQPQGAM